MQFAIYEYGSLLNHHNEEARSRYLASLLKLFYPSFMESSSIAPKNSSRCQLTESGKIEHVFYTFSNTATVFAEEKFGLAGNRRDQATAQGMAECDGLDFANSNNGYCCPILTDGITFKPLMYDSSTGEVFCSLHAAALTLVTDYLNFLGGVRRGGALPLFCCLLWSVLAIAG